MKAAFIKQFGGPEVLKYGDLPNPVAGPVEVVIDVVAATLTAPIGRCASASINNLGRDFWRLRSRADCGPKRRAIARLALGAGCQHVQTFCVSVRGLLEMLRQTRYAQGISLRITEDMVAQCFAAFGAE